MYQMFQKSGARCGEEVEQVVGRWRKWWRRSGGSGGEKGVYRIKNL